MTKLYFVSYVSFNAKQGNRHRGLQCVNEYKKNKKKTILRIENNNRREIKKTKYNDGHWIFLFEVQIGQKIRKLEKSPTSKKCKNRNI